MPPLRESGSSSPSRASTATTSGAKIIALALRDAGADVIYTGLAQDARTTSRAWRSTRTPTRLGLSILSGSHSALVAATIDSLRRLGVGDIKVFVGGTDPRTGPRGA